MLGRFLYGFTMKLFPDMITELQSLLDTVVTDDNGARLTKLGALRTVSSGRQQPETH